jgi:hypothetical protein
MKREKQIREAAKKTTGLFSYRNGYSTAEDAFVEGARWSDRTILQEVIEWLNENFYTSDIECADSYLPEYVLNGNFESKEEMLQSFKERFNIVDDCDQQYPSDFINDR